MVCYGNPGRRTHMFGWEAESAVEDARKALADLIAANPKEIIFTSGARESNNMAIKGVANFLQGAKEAHHRAGRTGTAAPAAGGGDRASSDTAGT